MSSPLNLWRRAEQLKLAAIDSPKNSSEAWINRQSLQEIYQNLLIADLEFSLDKKVEQDLWNFAFKKQIVTLQSQCKDKQNQKRGEIQAGLNLFLDAASGFYIQLIQEISSIFGLDLPFRRKCKKLGIAKECQILLLKSKLPGKSSCLYLCQDCLVHLGDIARYRLNYDQAEVFYKHAALLVPMNGQPYNQLAILEVQKGNKLSTIFYHTRSLAVQYPFPVAEINCNKFYARISKDGQDSRQKVVTNEWLSMFLQFLASVHLELDPMKSRIRLDRILLSFKPNLSSLGFNSRQLLQMLAILFYEYQSIIEKRLKNSGKSHTYRHLVTKDTHDVCYRKDDGDKNFVTIDDDDEEEEDDEFAEHEGRIHKRGVLSGILLSGKELEEVYKKRIVMVLELAETMMESLLIAANEREELRELLLPIVKIMLDWLTSNEEVVAHAVILNSGLWATLCPLVNNLIAELSKHGHPENFIEAYKSMPLPEDGELQCFLPLKLSHSHLSFTWKNLEKLSKVDERTLRIFRILGSCEALEKASSGILKAKYSSDSKKTLLSFETSLPKNKPVHSDIPNNNNNTAFVDKRPSRLNVAIQTILQKSSVENHSEQRLEGDGEGISKQTKKLLKVEFKEAIEDIWKERDPNKNQMIFESDCTQAQIVDRNNNNSPHMSYNFCPRSYPYHSHGHPPPYYGFPYQAPMYPLYPLPPPPSLPFAYRPGCPLPAPPSMIPRFNPMTSYGISVTSSDSTICSESDTLKMSGNAKGNTNFTSSLELNCTPSKAAGCLNASPQVATTLSTAPNLAQHLLANKEINKGSVNEAQRYPTCSQFPTFQPMHPFPFPRPAPAPIHNAGNQHFSPHHLLPTLRSPYGGSWMPGYCQSSGEQKGQPHSFLKNESNSDSLRGPHDNVRQAFVKEREDLMIIPPKPCGGFIENHLQTGDFARQNQSIHDAGIFRGANQCVSTGSSSVNIFGARFSNHGPSQSPFKSEYDLKLNRAHGPGINKQNISHSHSNLKPPPSQMAMCSQPYSHLSLLPKEINNQPENVETRFGNSLPSQAPPVDWWCNTTSNCNVPEKLEGFDVRLCAQRNFNNRISEVVKYPNCNNSSSEGKQDENVAASSYNLFSQSPWSPALSNRSDLNANETNIGTTQRSGLTVHKPNVDNSTDVGAGGVWNGFPSVTNLIHQGQVSIMKSTSSAVVCGNTLQHAIATTAAWSCQPTPLEKLLQMQKQLKPIGN